MASEGQKYLKKDVGTDIFFSQMDETSEWPGIQTCILLAKGRGEYKDTFGQKTVSNLRPIYRGKAF